MSTDTIDLKLADYKSDEKPTWCPGCGDFGVLNAVYNALLEQGNHPKDIVSVSGIGCSSRIPFFMNSYGFHGVHGRAMPISAGIKSANPDLHVITLGGDGDAFAIGASHLLHAARRNVDLTYIIMDNAVYGLTKGQTSPTSDYGYATKTTPKGSKDAPLNPLLLALAAGASFVGRAFSARPKELTSMILEAIEHPGFAIIDAYSPCPTFNKINTFKSYRELTADLPADHDPTDFVQAINRAAVMDPLYLGVFYKSVRPTFLQNLQALASGTEADTDAVLENLYQKFS